MGGQLVVSYNKGIFTLRSSGQFGPELPLSSAHLPRFYKQDLHPRQCFIWGTTEGNEHIISTVINTGLLPTGAATSCQQV